jgi:hypothetical protein
MSSGKPTKAPKLSADSSPSDPFAYAKLAQATQKIPSPANPNKKNAKNSRTPVQQAGKNTIRRSEIRFLRGKILICLSSPKYS